MRTRHVPSIGTLITGRVVLLVVVAAPSIVAAWQPSLFEVLPRGAAAEADVAVVQASR